MTHTEEAKNTARKMKIVALELLFGLAVALYCGISGFGIIAQVVPNLMGGPTVQLNVAEALVLLTLVLCSFWVMYITGGMIDELHAAIKEGESNA